MEGYASIAGKKIAIIAALWGLFLTLMLLVQRIGLPQPHQTDEQQHGPEDLHQEADLGKPERKKKMFDSEKRQQNRDEHEPRKLLYKCKWHDLLRCIPEF